MKRFAVLSSLALALALAPAAVQPVPAAAQQRVEGPVETTLSDPAAFAGPVGRQALSGPWAVALDPDDQGERKGWPTGNFAGRRRDLPYSPNARQLTGDAGQRAFKGSIAWYRTQVRVPADGDYVLRFESAHHYATVWVDGKKVAGHTGAYLPFEARVTLRKDVPHTVVVRTNYESPTRQKRSGWHRTWFNFGGLNREVTIRPVGASELSSPEVRTRLDDRDGHAVVTVAVRVTNRAPQRRTLGVQGTLTREGQQVPVGFPAVDLDPGATKVVRAAVRVDQPALWQPGSPNLYQLDLGVPGEAGYRQRVGLRELTWQGEKLFLNGKRLRLHGASIHEDVRGRGDALRPADMDGLVAGLQAIGANATRSQHQLNPALLERLDAAGIMVWQGIGPIDAPGAWTNRTAAQQRTARKRVRVSYFQTQPFPSVIAWNLANEVAGNGHPAGQIPYVVQMSRELHRRDPGRLVAVDVWGAHPPRTRLGRLYGDVDAIAVTNYAGWYEDPLAPAGQVRRLIKRTTKRFERTFRGKVLVISEFGAEANALNEAGRPGSFSFQTRLLDQHIEVYKASPQISGMLVWNLRDFAVSPSFFGGSIRGLVPGIKLLRGINQKGLFDFDNRPKPAVEAVRRQFAPLGTGLDG